MRERGLFAIHTVCDQADDKADVVLLNAYDCGASRPGMEVDFFSNKLHSPGVFCIFYSLLYNSNIFCRGCHAYCFATVICCFQGSEFLYFSFFASVS